MPSYGGIGKSPSQELETGQRDKTAEQRKNEELYGASVKKFGVGKKHDGTLMGKAPTGRTAADTL